MFLRLYSKLYSSGVLLGQRKISSITKSGIPSLLQPDFSERIFSDFGVVAENDGLHNPKMQCMKLNVSMKVTIIALFLYIILHMVIIVEEDNKIGVYKIFVIHYIKFINDEKMH